MEFESRDGRDEYLKSGKFAGLVGSRLRQARCWSGLQYGDVADELCVDKEQVRKIEMGIWLPTVWELVVLADLYKCSLDWLLGHSDDPQTRAERIAAAQNAPLEPVANLNAIDLDRCEGERMADRYAVPTSQESRRKMCFSKRRFRSESSGVKGAINSSRIYGQPMRVYRCPLCGGWHLTSQEMPEFQPMAAAM